MSGEVLEMGLPRVPALAVVGFSGELAPWIEEILKKATEAAVPILIKEVLDWVRTRRHRSEMPRSKKPRSKKRTPRKR